MTLVINCVPPEPCSKVSSTVIVSELVPVIASELVPVKVYNNYALTPP